MNELPTEAISPAGLDHKTMQDTIQEIEGILVGLQNRMDDVRKNVEQDFLEEAISVLQTTLDDGITSGEDRTMVYHQLIRALLARYGLYGWIEDLDHCTKHFFQGVGTEAFKKFLLVCQGGVDNVPDVQIATQLITVYERSINVAILDSIVETATQALASYNGMYSSDKLKHQAARLWIVLGNALVMKYLSNGDVSALDQATRSFQQAELDCLKDTPLVYISLAALLQVELLQLIKHGDEYALRRIINYRDKTIDADAEGANQLEVGLGMVCSAADDAQLQEGIARLIASLHCRMEGHPRRCESLNGLACAFHTRFKTKGDFGELERSVELLREALYLCEPSHPPHPDRRLTLYNLADSLATRFRNKGAFEDLEECIARHREALDLPQPPLSFRWRSLNALASSLLTRFQCKGAFEDLEGCIALHREALDLPPHEDRPMSLNNLANALSTRFRHKGAFDDLEECIALHREALDLRPRPHPDRASSLINLALSLGIRFEHKGAIEDLEECIALQREAVNLHQLPLFSRSTLLHNLANSFSIRFKHKGAFEDLEECIALNREALNLRQSPHPNRADTLNNLAISLYTRFNHKEAFKDFEESIELLREALYLCQPPHPNRFNLLNSLAMSLVARFKHKGAFEDLEECIALNRAALDLVQPPNPSRSISLNNLASSLLIRFQLKGTSEDIEECIALHRAALDLRPTPHPERSESLENLANSLTYRCVHTGNLQDLYMALDYYQDAAKYPTGSLLTRLRVSKRWATCAQHHCPVSALDAYKYSMELLPQLASLDLTLQQRQDVLQHARDLVGNAAKFAIDASQCELAVTFLSIGRSIFWSQALHLRSPVDDLMVTNTDIAQRFILVSRKLENASYSQHASISSSSSSLAGESHPSIGTYEGLHLLVKERQEIIEEIRGLPGYENFLQAPSFSTLQPAAKNGPIILLSMSQFGCDALIVHGEGAVEHIPLPNIDLQGLVNLNHLIHSPLTLGVRTVEIPQNVKDSLWKMLGRDMVLETSSTSMSRDEALRSALEILWVAVVRPVITALGVTKTNSPKRLWWCPTGLYSSLPIHAAGIYSDDNNPIDCLFQYAISSYCTSPQDLLHPPPPISQSFKVTAVIEPEAPKAGPLPATRTELDKIKKLVPDQQHLITHVGSRIHLNQVKNVLSDIQQSSFVHFGCHGMQNFKNPLESHLLLSGGNLTMSALMKDCRVPEGALAYLSACETAKGDEKRPDESLNLVATMMFSGFRSVVGTLWSILDNDAPIVADVFYQHLFRNGTDALPDVRDAAYGLHLATEELRNQGRPLHAWVPYVHYGI